MTERNDRKRQWVVMFGSGEIVSGFASEDRAIHYAGHFATARVVEAPHD